MNFLESEDPLHLCVSSKYSEVYVLACKCVEELLLNIYNEYKLFCHKMGRRCDPNLKVKRIEAFGKAEQSPNGNGNDKSAMDYFNQQFEQMLEINEAKTPKAEERKDQKFQETPKVNNIAGMHQTKLLMGKEESLIFNENNIRELFEQRGISFLEDKIDFCESVNRKKNEEVTTWKNSKN